MEEQIGKWVPIPGDFLKASGESMPLLVGVESGGPIAHEDTPK